MPWIRSIAPIFGAAKDSGFGWFAMRLLSAILSILKHLGPKLDMKGCERICSSNQIYYKPVTLPIFFAVTFPCHASEQTIILKYCTDICLAWARLGSIKLKTRGKLHIKHSCWFWSIKFLIMQESIPSHSPLSII